MANSNIHVSDVGTQFIITVKDAGAVVNLVLATLKRFKFTKPSGNTLLVNADFVTDGSDGQLTYTSITGDLDEEGYWKLQILITLPGGSYSSDIIPFIIYPNL